MKKTVLFIAVISAFSFASCKKDRVCTCVSTSSLGGSAYTDVTTFTKSKKGAARANCLSSTSTGSNGNVAYVLTRTCSLK